MTKDVVGKQPKKAEAVVLITENRLKEKCYFQIIIMIKKIKSSGT